MHQFAEVVWSHRETIDETWTVEQVEALAEDAPFGTICDIKLVWLDPGDDVLRGVFTTRMDCIADYRDALFGEVFVIRRDENGNLVGWRWDLDSYADDPIAEIEWEPTDKNWPMWYPLHDIPSP
ncbi:MAG: hypothetical protein AAFR76_01795 [Planctomycetota bacterium]